MTESAKKEILMFLGAYPREWLRAALKEFTRAERENRLAEGWELWTGPEPPPRPYEWRKHGDLIYYRMPPPQSERVTVSAAVQRRAAGPSTAATKICPDCGAQAFASTVCPKCAKGKAGIRKQWVCGENSDHVFYTE